MAIRKKLLALDSVDSSRVLLENNTALRAKDASGALVDVLKLDTSNALKLITADSSSNSGDISIQTGTATGTRGNILLNAGQVTTSANIVPDSDNGRDLGAVSRLFRIVHSRAFQTIRGKMASETTPVSNVPANAVTDFASLANPVALMTYSKNAASTNSGPVYIESGNATGSTSNSGDISIQTGTATGTRGKIVLNAGQVTASANIIPDASGTRDIGGASALFRVVFAAQLQTGFGKVIREQTPVSGVQAHSLTDNSSGTTPVAVTTSNRSLASTHSSNVLIETGNATGPTSNSGDINIQTGTATGTRGRIILDADSVLTVKSILPSATGSSTNQVNLGSISNRFYQVNWANSLASGNGTIQNSGTSPSGVASNFGFMSTAVAAGVLIHSIGEAANTKPVLIESGNSTGSATSSGEIRIKTGTATGARGKILLDGSLIDVSSNNIANLADATLSHHAVNKGQLDAGILEAKDYADSKVAALVNSAPAVLDTLQELAEALGNDPAFATTISGQLGDIDSRLDAIEAEQSSQSTDIQAQLDTLVVPVQHYQSITIGESEIASNSIEVAYDIVGTPWVVRDMLIGIPGVHYSFTGKIISFLGEWANPEGLSKIEDGDTVQVYFMRNTQPFA
jgi:hypothetical protein